MAMQQTFQVANQQTKQQQQFWQRWLSDYLQSLQQRRRWGRTFPDLQQGDLILVREDITTPLHWRTAVITDIRLPQMASYAWSLRHLKGT